MSPVILGQDDTEALKRIVRRKLSPQRTVIRARIILLSAEGKSNTTVAQEMGVTRNTVGVWVKRFQTGGVKALEKDAPGRGRKASITGETIQKIINDTLQTRPEGATHWSCRSMADYQGVSKATIQRIWNAHHLQPHREKTFKLSTDKQFREKLTDVVGLYLNPPEKALVLCVDEKSQIQALNRTQPCLPLASGKVQTRTHDYQRNGTTSLFAALNYLDGKVMSACYPRHRNDEFLKFLKKINRETPKDKQLHLILDNYSTHKHENVEKWLAKHPRFHLHFTPTSASWLNLVERWFREITDKQIRRGVFCSVKELEAAIQEFIDTWNGNPRPFIWTASVQDILGKVEQCKLILETGH